MHKGDMQNCIEWRRQESEVGAKFRGLRDGSPQRGPGTEPRWGLEAKPQKLKNTT